MNPMTIQLAVQEHTRELHRVADHARRHPAIRRARRTTIATPRPGRREPPQQGGTGPEDRAENASWASIGQQTVPGYRLNAHKWTLFSVDGPRSGGPGLEDIVSTIHALLRALPSPARSDHHRLLVLAARLARCSARALAPLGRRRMDVQVKFFDGRREARDTAGHPFEGQPHSGFRRANARI